MVPRSGVDVPVVRSIRVLIFARVVFIHVKRIHPGVRRKPAVLVRDPGAVLDLIHNTRRRRPGENHRKRHAQRRQGSAEQGWSQCHGVYGYLHCGGRASLSLPQLPDVTVIPPPPAC